MTREDPAAFAPPPAFGPFRVLHQIGVGALGPVFRTYEPTRDRLIAVKVFRLDITPEQAQALADELSKAADAGLFHPSIVEPVAAGLEGTAAYRAEEYVAAESLDAAIRHYAPAPVEKALPFITQLAGAIDFARAAGIGHGALHLRDIFMTPEEARASGFGVVEALERTGLRAPVRRPYAAPERIAGEAWSTPADVFSLAAITYELLTGRRPAGTGNEILPVSAAEAGAPARAITQVLTRAMDADPGARYPTALGFASALEAAAAGETVDSAPPATDAAPGIAAAAPVVAAGAADLDEPDPEPFDDIAVERDDDEAYYGLATGTSAAVDAEAGGLFDDPDVEEDLALAPAPGGVAPGRTRDDGDALNSAAAASLLDLDAVPDRHPPGRVTGAGYGWGDTAAPPETTQVGELDYREPAAVGPPRTAMLPGAVGLVLGLLIGFAAAYAIFSRAPVMESGETSTAAPPAVTSEPSPAAGVAPSDTEQRLSPPPAAPEVPDEVPAPDPAPVATSGSLIVESTPPKANVTINGQWRGRTPLTLDDQPFGTYNIRVVQDGFSVANESVTLNVGSPEGRVSVRLERAPPAATPRPQPPPAPRPQARPPAAPTTFLGSMFVDSRPQGARVLVNGKAVGSTPLRLSDLAIGSHVVRLELDGHRVWTTSARVQAGQQTRVTGSLEPIR